MINGPCSSLPVHRDELQCRFIEVHYVFNAGALHSPRKPDVFGENDAAFDGSSVPLGSGRELMPTLV
jgi:hypothetical protein